MKWKNGETLKYSQQYQINTQVYEVLFEKVDDRNRCINERNHREWIQSTKPCPFRQAKAEAESKIKAIEEEYFLKLRNELGYCKEIGCV